MGPRSVTCTQLSVLDARCGLPCVLTLDEVGGLGLDLRIHRGNRLALAVPASFDELMEKVARLESNCCVMHMAYWDRLWIN